MRTIPILFRMLAVMLGVAVVGPPPIASASYTTETGGSDTVVFVSAHGLLCQTPEQIRMVKGSWDPGSAVLAVNALAGSTVCSMSALWVHSRKDTLGLGEFFPVLNGANCEMTRVTVWALGTVNGREFMYPSPQRWYTCLVPLSPLDTR